MLADERGLALTTEVPEAARLLDVTLKDNLESRLGATESLKAMLAADPEFVLGHCFKGSIFLLFGNTAYYPKVAEALDFCEARLKTVTPREAAHVRALRAIYEGDQRRAGLIWDEILIQHPRDLMALRLQHFNHFYMGNSSGLRDALARVLPAWNDDVPGAGFVYGMYAFGLEEAGDYDRAEVQGRRAVAMNSNDLWAIHAVAHVMEMQGRLNEGLDWLSQPLELWADRNAFKEHLWWHRALYLLELGRLEETLALYDQAVRLDQESDFYLNLVNCAALLWRLDFLGLDLGDRWEELADHCEKRVEDHALVFSDVHFTMVLAAAGREAALEAQLASMASFAGQNDHFGSQLIKPLVLPLAKAIKSFAAGDYGDCTNALLALRNDYAPLGGSHAQRDVFDLFLIEAALRDRQTALARALLAERLARKPNSAGSWRKYAEVLEALGDLQGAAQACRHFDAVMVSGSSAA